MTSRLVASASAERAAADSLLEGFWASDTWLMRTCPLGVGHGIMRFGGLTRQLSDELKLAVRAKLTASEWSIQTEQAFLINRIVVWLASRHPATTSLLNRPLERWMVALQGYLLEQGLLRQPMRRQLSRAQEETRTPLRDPAIVMLRSLYAKITMQATEHRSFQTPDETRAFPNGRAEIVKIGDAEVGRLVFEPGWRWSKDVKPIAKTNTCEAPHFQYHVSGRLAIRMDDGTEFEAGPGDVTSLPSGHDAWVVGNEPVVTVDWFGASNYAR